MKFCFACCLLVAGLALGACNSGGGNNYRDYSQSTQRRASMGVTNDDVLKKHETNASNPNNQNNSNNSNEGSDTTQSPEEEAEANQHSKVRVHHEAGEKEEKTGGVVEHVENRPASKPTPTPHDDMNKPLDPVGRPVTEPSPGG